MKRAFHNIFGGKKEKEKDPKSLDVPSEDRRYGSAVSLDSASCRVASEIPHKTALSSNPSFSETGNETSQDKLARKQQQRIKSLQQQQPDTQQQQQPTQQQQLSAAIEQNEPSHELTKLRDRKQNTSDALVADTQPQSNHHSKQRRKDSKGHPQLQHPRYQMQGFDATSEPHAVHPSRSLPYQTTETKISQQKIALLQQTVSELQVALKTARSRQVASHQLPGMMEEGPSISHGADLCRDLDNPRLASIAGCAMCGCTRLTSSSDQISAPLADVTTSLTSSSSRDHDVTTATSSSASQTDECGAVRLDAAPARELVSQSVQTEPVVDSVSVSSVELSSEIARLASVQQQLSKVPLLPLTSRVPEPASPQTLVAVEVQTESDLTTGEVAVRELSMLKEKFEVLLTSRQALEEQRNELEEAENDARLMVQRLEMKLFTAGEVERMLTAELNESRESYSQIQRQLTSAKLRHQAELRGQQAECASAAERLQLLEKELREVRAQLHQKTERAEKAEECPSEEQSGGARSLRDGDGSDEPRRSEGPSPLLGEKSSTFSDSGVGEDLLHASEGATPSEDCPASPASVSPTRITISYPDSASHNADNVAGPPTPLICSICSGEIGNASMTAMAGNSLDFILDTPWPGGQIESDVTPPSEQTDRLRHRALHRFTSAEDDVIDQLKNALQQQLNTFEDERSQIISLHCSEMKTLQEERSMLQVRLRASQAMLTAIRDEIQLSADELQLAAESAETPELTSADVPADLGVDVSPAALLQRIRETRRAECRLASQVCELEKKENAYRETLEEADRIMQAVEQRHLRTVEELEHQLRETKNRINFMEGTEEKLKAALYSSSGKRESQRVAELLDKLIETETEDLKLKEKVYRLERREREQSIRLREEERTSERLRLELSDQEELLRELDSAKRELSDTREQQVSLTALRQRATELQLSEGRFRERCEELEQTESSLQEQLNRTQQSHAHRERRLSEQLQLRQHESDSLQAQLVELQLQQVAATEELAQLRRELQLTKQQLQLAETADGDQRRSEETLLKSREVEALQSQLSQVSRQLSEKELHATDLRIQLDQLQSEHAELRQTLDCERTRAEQDILQLNLALSRREQEEAAVTSQMARAQVSRELDTLSEQESTLTRLLALVRAGESRLNACPACCSASEAVLSSLALGLQQLLALINGGSSSSDRSLQDQLKDAEALSAAAARVAKPPDVSTGVQTERDPRVTHLETKLEMRQKELSTAEERLRQVQRLLSQQQQQENKTEQVVVVRQHTEERRGTAEERRERPASEHREEERTGDQRLQLRSTPAEDGLSSSSEAGTSSSCSKLSRIPRRLSKPVEAVPAPAPADPTPRKVSPPSRVPLPRRTQSARDTTAVPPVGVARPYRSTLAPLMFNSRQRSPAGNLPPRECSQTHPALPDSVTAESGLTLPPPSGFQIIRTVGGDSLLLYWNPVEDHRITGYQIFVNNELQLQIRNPQRTKALLPGMDLSCTLRLAIRAVAGEDAVSEPSSTEYRPSEKTVC